VKLSGQLEGHRFTHLLTADNEGHIFIDNDAAKEYAAEVTAVELDDKQAAAHKAARKIAHELNQLKNKYGPSQYYGQIVRPDHTGQWKVSEATILTHIR